MSFDFDQPLNSVNTIELILVIEEYIVRHIVRTRRDQERSRAGGINLNEIKLYAKSRRELRGCPLSSATLPTVLVSTTMIDCNQIFCYIQVRCEGVGG